MQQQQKKIAATSHKSHGRIVTTRKLSPICALGNIRCSFMTVVRNTQCGKNAVP